MEVDEIVAKVWGPKEEAVYSTRKSPPGSREKILDVIAKSAYNNNRAFEGCTRCVLLALQTYLHIEDEGTLRASTAMAAGVARMGETCGALLGGIMAIGLVRGRAELEDFDAYVETMKMGVEMFNRFKEKMGSPKCFDIQERFLGRRFNFFNEEDREAWYKGGGIEICPWVCGEAARMAADIILKHQESIMGR